MNRTIRRTLLAAPLAAAVVAGGGMTAVDAQTPKPKADWLRLKPGDVVDLSDAKTVRPEDFPVRPGTPVPGATDPNAIRGATPEQMLAQARQRPAQRPGPDAEFEATKGKRVKIAGRDVQLPPDAGIEASAIFVRPIFNEKGQRLGDDKRPTTEPFDAVRVAVRRGDAKAIVGAATRRLLYVTPGREADFAFLTEALR